MKWDYQKYPLRDYQREFCRACTDAFDHGPEGTPLDNVLGVAGTGAGKTIMAAALILEEIKRRQGRALFLADRDELVSQGRDKIFRATGIITDAEQGPSYASLGSDVVVASVQSLSIQRRLERFPRDHFTKIVADEAHLSLAESWQRVFAHFDRAKILGITATPARADKKSLLKFYQTIAYEITLFDLINKGALVPVRVVTAPVEVDIGDADIGDGEDNAEQAEAVRPYWNAIIDAWLKNCGKMKTLIFHPSRAASRDFSAMLQERGIASAHVQGDSKNRDELKKLFARGDIQVLNNAQLLTTGYDEPTIECILILKMVGSKTSYQQMVGRGTRLWCPRGCNTYCTCTGAKREMVLLDLLWQYEKKGVMRPEDLIAETEEQKTAIRERLKKTDEKFDLQELDREVYSDREQDVIKALRKHQGKMAREFDARTVAALFHQPNLLDYEPLARWETAKATDAQLSALLRLGVDVGTVTCKGHASFLLTALGERIERQMASVRQVAQLTKQGVRDAHLLTFSQASERMDQIFGNRPLHA